ncbi:response regulator [Bradyrhizobium liaoningense]
MIEDEPQIGAYISRLLGQLHGIVDLVGSIAEASQALENFKYDLAIVDRMLPDGDALQVVTALSQSPERPAIIMLTSKDAKGRRRRGPQRRRRRLSRQAVRASGTDRARARRVATAPAARALRALAR